MAKSQSLFSKLALYFLLLLIALAAVQFALWYVFSQQYLLEIERISRSPHALSELLPAALDPMTGDKEFAEIVKANLRIAEVQQKYMVSGSIAVFGVAVALAALIGLIAFYRETRPLAKICAAVESYRDGITKTRIDLSRKDQLARNDQMGMLAGVFNQLADTLDAVFKEMQGKDTRQRSMLSGAVKELRAPISSAAETLERLGFDFEIIRREERLGLIESATAQLQQSRQLLNDLTDLSRLEAREVLPKPILISVAEFFQKLKEKFHVTLEQRNIRFALNCDPQVTLIQADSGLLERVFANLMDNALSRTIGDTAIEVSVAKAGDAALVTFTDTGEPIAPGADASQIFESLSLSLVRKILELSSSSISASKVPGKGNVFTFALRGG